MHLPDYSKRQNQSLAHLGWIALLASEIALKTKMASTALSMLIITKQKMPKLCIGRRVCQTSLPSSLETHTLTSVNKKMKSTIKRMIIAAMIYFSR